MSESGREWQQERPRLVLCLSGGGKVAAAFHAGAILALRELGLLRQIKVVSSVCAGAIVAGLLAVAYDASPRITERVPLVIDRSRPRRAGAEDGADTYAFTIRDWLATAASSPATREGQEKDPLYTRMLWPLWVWAVRNQEADMLRRRLWRPWRWLDLWPEELVHMVRERMRADVSMEDLFIDEERVVSLSGDSGSHVRRTLAQRTPVFLFTAQSSAIAEEPVCIGTQPRAVRYVHAGTGVRMWRAIKEDTGASWELARLIVATGMPAPFGKLEWAHRGVDFGGVLRHYISNGRALDPLAFRAAEVMYMDMRLGQGEPDAGTEASRKCLMVDAYTHSRMWRADPQQTRQDAAEVVRALRGGVDRQHEKLRGYRCNIVQMLDPQFATELADLYRLMGWRDDASGAFVPRASDEDEDEDEDEKKPAQVATAQEEEDEGLASLDADTFEHAANWGYLLTWHQWGWRQRPARRAISNDYADPHGIYCTLFGPPDV